MVFEQYQSVPVQFMKSSNLNKKIGSTWLGLLDTIRTELDYTTSIK